MNLSKALRLTGGDVVAFVGGGGKSTAMFQLAAELAHQPQQKLRVLTTTSTRIFAAQIKQSPVHVAFNPETQTIADLLPQLETALDQHNQVLLIGQADPHSGKAFGIPPDIIDTLAATGRFDLILNEADGSRMRPFKAPAGHEPVIPVSTTVVVPVVGLDILGQPLNETTTHRAALVSQLSNTPLEQKITSQTIAQVLTHPDGGLKNAPHQARIIPLINKVDTPPRVAQAQILATNLLNYPAIDTVILGQVQNPLRPVISVSGRSAAIILAAGGSRRFGSPKQLAPWGDKTLLEHTVELALNSRVDRVIVVLGAEIEQSNQLLKNKSVDIVINEQWATGQSTSMQAGLKALPDQIQSAIILLVDLPKITTALINTLIERHQHSLPPLVWPEFEGKRGNPVLFDRRLFLELMQISGDTGGRPVLMAHQHEAQRVAVTDDGILQDVDRPEDLK